MIKTENKEQALCVQCGLCCTGVLFNKARLRNNEKDIRLAEKLTLKVIKMNERYAFSLPCHHYINHYCSVYHKMERPRVCRNFVCKLIFSFRSGDVNFAEAEKIIWAAKSKAGELADAKAQFEVFNHVNVAAVGKRLDLLRLNCPDESVYRKKYGKVIIHHYVLMEFLREHFYKLKNSIQDSKTNTMKE